MACRVPGSQLWGVAPAMFRSPTSVALLCRIGCGVFGLVCIAMALPMLLQGRLAYENWLHAGLVFLPFVLVFGVVALLAAIFNWKRIFMVPGNDTANRHTKHSQHHHIASRK